MTATLAADTSLGALLSTSAITAVVSVAASLLLARLTFHFVRRKEMDAELERTMRAKAAELSEELRKEINFERAKRDMDRQDRVQSLMHAAAAPLLVASDDLLGRLRNILDQEGYVQLRQNWDQERPRGWSSTHDYFMSSSVYVFARYFSHVEMVREKLGADEVLARSDPLTAALVRSAHRLAAWPTIHNREGCPGEDRQVFTWQQRALGQVLIARENGRSRVMSYAEFLSHEAQTSRHQQPLREFLIDISPEPPGNCRWRRLGSVRQALQEVRDRCATVLGVQDE